MDLKIGYYTIYIVSNRKDMTTIVTKIEKIVYNWILMGMCTSWDTFQDKLEKILGYIDSVYAYIENILVLSNDNSLNI